MGKSNKSACDISGVCSVCKCPGKSFDEQKNECASAVRSTMIDCCMHLCADDRCNSFKAYDIAQLDIKEGL